MATTSFSSPARTSNSRIALRVVVALSVLALIVFIAFDVWFYRAVRAALPQEDGTIKLAGLSQSVTVTRDALGVPTIAASNLNDLFFAQGYVTAQERLWQMDMTRRYASGDLSVILGPDFVRVDREQRILGLRQTAERVVAAMNPVQRAQFQAYANGVNSYIAEHMKTLPLEFRFLTYSPHVWTVEDSLLVGLSMTEFLNHGYYREILLKEKALARLGPELTADLFVNSSWRDHPPGSEAPSLESSPPAGLGTEDEETPPPTGKGRTPAKDKAPARPLRRSSLVPVAMPVPDAAPEIRYHAGSNNWVVSGAHTVSGKPLLSNDMHLELRLPNTWYEAHLICGDFDVVGVTLPGMPYVIVGHNRYVAWGFTNLGPAVEDIYIEKFNDKGEYLTPQGWVQPEHRKEIIRVKGKPEVNVDVVVTRHGPIISSLVPGETRQLALQSIIYKDGAESIPFFKVNLAKNWDEFRAAFSTFGAPGQNVVYADMDGHIGYQATGLVPIRASGDGSVPVPGDTDAYEWTGFIPYDQMPRVFDPPSGVIATANGRVTPDGYPYPMSIEWESPFRTERIYKLLGKQKKYSPADMLAIQTDVVSEFDRYCAERFVYAIDHTPKASERAKAAADLMRGWDGTMDTDSAAPTVAFYSRGKLNELLLRPKLGDDWKQYTRWFMNPVWLENILSHQPAQWFPDGYANYDELLVAAVEAAVADPKTPSPLSRWTWGRVHQIDVKHPFWSNFPILKRGAGPGPHPLSGDGLTVKQAGERFGPSERFTADMSNLDNSTLNIVNGESGNLFDEHYNDQWDAYYHGRTFKLPFSSAVVEEAAQHHLKLEPQ
ncbi:MAG TPA: penicillin acylase family protein [Candidatus Eisenbacteria bacterium]|nr:penicillin acylase family protein [Candidatus Eisenbacteria bacterium]